MIGIERQNHNDNYIENENKVMQELQKADEIINIFKTRYGEDSEKYKNILKEYNEIFNTYDEAKANDLKISKEELEKILKEIEDVLNFKQVKTKNNNIPLETTKNKQDDFEKIKTEIETELKINQDTTLEEIKEKILNANQDQINKLKKFFELQEKLGICSILGNIKSMEIYPTLNQKILEINKDKFNNSINNLLKEKNIKPEIKEKITTEIKDLILNPENNCTIENIDEINNVFIKYGLEEINFKDKDDLYRILESGIQIKKAQNINKKLEIETSLGITIDEFTLLTKEQKDNLIKSKNLDPNIINEINQTIETENSFLIIEENIEISKTANKEEFEEILEDIKKGTEPKDIMKNLKTNIKERQEKEEQKQEKEQETNTKKDSEIIDQKEETQTYYQETQTGNYELTSNSGKKIEIPLTKNELQYIQNEKVKENIISFYTLLNDLNISNLWEYRDNILQAFSNKYQTHGFNIYDNFLDEKEQKIFLKGILKSIGINIQSHNINDIKNKIISTNTSDNNFIIKKFKEKYIPDQCVLKQSSLEQNI